MANIAGVVKLSSGICKALYGRPASFTKNLSTGREPWRAAV